MSGQVRREEDGAVRILTLDRPERRNAFTVALYRELTAALREADSDQSVPPSC